MVSVTAFDLLNVVAAGDVTVHTLWLGFHDRLSFQQAADELLLNSLIELTEAGLISWAIEEDYGRSPPTKPTSYSADRLVDAWKSAFGNSGPRPQESENSTIKSVQRRGARRK